MTSPVLAAITPAAVILFMLLESAQCDTITASWNTDNTTNVYDPYECKKGLFLPKWEPSEGIFIWERVLRAIIYFLSLFYMFLGVSIIADRFMSSIEVITAKEKEVTLTKPTGEVITLRVKIWNETVSNLTLMALGSSAPEIMLSALEIIGMWEIIVL